MPFDLPVSEDVTVLAKVLAHLIWADMQRYPNLDPRGEPVAPEGTEQTEHGGGHQTRFAKARLVPTPEAKRTLPGVEAVQDVAGKYGINEDLVRKSTLLDPRSSRFYELAPERQ